MVDNTWEARYSKAVGNKYRDFNLGGDTNYPACNIRCNFDVTKLEDKDFIRGISATSSENLLHINPVVNTSPPQKGLQAVGVHTGETSDRKKKFYIKYGFKGEGGIPNTYELLDIFFRAPSKAVVMGKRYQMEVCLLFSSEEHNRYLIVCVPIEVSSVNTTDDPLQKNLYTFLLAIANNFPTKGKTYSIEDAPNWDPRVLLPVNRGTNASFFTWIDPTTNNTVMYIQFKSPITVPYKFFESFATTLSGGVNTAKQLTTLSPQKEHADLEVYYNVNQPNVNITTTKQCKEVTLPFMQQLVNFNVEEAKKEKDKEKKKEKQPKCEKIICKTNYQILFWVGLVAFALLGLILLYLYITKWRKKPITNNQLSSNSSTLPGSIQQHSV